MRADFWKPYIDLEAHYRPHFPSGARVLDVGCGDGRMIDYLRTQGHDAHGIEPCPTSPRPDVCQGQAESMPFESGAFTGILCRVALPYTDERKALEEMARVCAPGATIHLSSHGLGYYVRYALHGSLKEKVYCLRTIINTALYRCLGTRPLGDTIFQTPRRLRRLYRACGLSLQHESPTKRFLGLPVLSYHSLIKP